MPSKSDGLPQSTQRPQRNIRLLSVLCVLGGEKAVIKLVAEATLGIQLEVLAEDLAWSLRVHPTLSESLVEAGRAVFGQALYVPKF